MWGGILTAIAGALVLVLPAGWPLADASYDLAYLVRPIEVPQEALIIRMDRQAHDDLDQPWMQAWDRRIHAALIDKLSQFKARAVVFDIVFDRPAKDPAEDQALIAAAKRFGKVAVAGVLTLDARHGTALGRRIEGPFDALRETVQWGLVNKAAPDLSMRRPLIGPWEKPTLEVVLGQMLGTGLPPPASAWLNYYGPPGTIDSCSYAEVLNDHWSPARFANRIIFVGAVYDIGFTGGRGTDEFRTPYSRWTGRRASGVEIIATTALNLIRADWLRRFSPWAEVGLIVGIGIVLGSTLNLLRPRATVVMSGLAFLVIAGLGVASVQSTQVWFPWLIPCLVQIPVAAAWSLLTIHSIAEQNERDLPTKTEPVASVSPPALEATDSAETVRLPFAGIAGAIPLVPSYKLIRRIGSGAYGEVWLAQDVIGLYRAVKIVQRRNFREPEPYEREFNGMRRFTPISLRHPGLVQVLHVGRDDEQGYFYYVMELADDEHGQEEINPQQFTPRTLESDLKTRRHMMAPETVQLGVQLAEALEFLHSHRLVHRDIKPTNTLYVRGQAKLGDIGLITTMADQGQNVSFLGTQGYMAPEGPGQAAADVYGLGKLLYVAAMGRGPADFPALPQDLEARPDRDSLLQLNRILLKACEPNVALRYASALELLQALRQLSGASR